MMSISLLNLTPCNSTWTWLRCGSWPEPGFGQNWRTKLVTLTYILLLFLILGLQTKITVIGYYGISSVPMDTVRVKSPSLLSNPLKSWESRNSVEVRLAKHHFEEDKFNQRQRTKRRLPPTEKWETWKYLCFSNRKACKHYPPAPTTYVE